MTSDWTRRRLLAAGATAVGAGVAGCAASPGGDRWDADVTLSVSNAHQYSSPGCSCCHEYASYLAEHLDGPLAKSVPDDVTAVKREHGIPEELRSCHTVVLDEYVVEGHVPVEAVATMLDEEPPIDGIALPGMPSGSPGMGGNAGDLTVYAVGGGRTSEVYARL